MDALLKCLARFTVVHLETHKPTLEELFLSYYEDREAPAAGAGDEEAQDAAAS